VGHVVSVDIERPAKAGNAEALAMDLDEAFDRALVVARFDAVLALDVLEHLQRPEDGAAKIATILKPGRNGFGQYCQHRVCPCG
jgi:2-polyprenyl-3-methyl-5-hydroxy-6-metoxy-1,4-benzoquinol methylase